MFYTYRNVLVIAGLVFCLFSSVFAYSGGNGEPNNPYQIATVSNWQELMNTSSHWNKYFIMTADVNLQGITLTPVGNSSKNFTGVFDGNGHIIRNAHINNPSSNYIGLFGYIYGAAIQNLGVENVSISSGGNFVGGLVGFNYSGSLTSCHVAGSVSGTGEFSYRIGGLVGMNRGLLTSCYAAGSVSGPDEVGGLVGLNWSDGTLTACYATSSASGTNEVGGLVGHCYGGTLNACYATGSVSGTDEVGGLVGWNDGSWLTGCYAAGSVSGSVNVGGLVGYHYGELTDCYATGSVTGTGGTGEYSSVGGLVGLNDGGSLTTCYAAGSVTGGEYSYHVGGLVGLNSSGSLTFCYAAGSVSGTGENFGGLVGINYYGSLTACYAVGSVSGSSYVGGLVGWDVDGSISACFWDIQTSGQSTSTGGTGKTTVEMKTLSTFTSGGWDFVDTWNIVQNQTYPFLRKYPTGDLNYDGRVNFADFALFADDWLEGI